MNALALELVEMGRLDVRITCKAEGLGPPLVGQDEEYIGPGRCFDNLNNVPSPRSADPKARSVRKCGSVNSSSAKTAASIQGNSCMSASAKIFMPRGSG